MWAGAARLTPLLIPLYRPERTSQEPTPTDIDAHPVESEPSCTRLVQSHVGAASTSQCQQLGSGIRGASGRLGLGAMASASPGSVASWGPAVPARMPTAAHHASPPPMRMPFLESETPESESDACDAEQGFLHMASGSAPFSFNHHEPSADRMMMVMDPDIDGTQGAAAVPRPQPIVLDPTAGTGYVHDDGRPAAGHQGSYRWSARRPSVGLGLGSISAPAGNEVQSGAFWRAQARNPGPGVARAQCQLPPLARASSARVGRFGGVGPGPVVAMGLALEGAAGAGRGPAPAIARRMSLETGGFDVDALLSGFM